MTSHDRTPTDDLNVLGMLKGATFGPNASLTLPTGTKLTGDEANSLVNIDPYETSDTGTVKPAESEIHFAHIGTGMVSPTREHPVTGNGTTPNPLARVMMDRPPREPTTVGEHAQWLVLRSAALSAWKNPETESTAVVLELLARMEGNIRGIRSLMNENAEESAKKLGKFAQFTADVAKIAKREKVEKWSPFI